MGSSFGAGAAKGMMRAWRWGAGRAVVVDLPLLTGVLASPNRSRGRSPRRRAGAGRRRRGCVVVTRSRGATTGAVLVSRRRRFVVRRGALRGGTGATASRCISERKASIALCRARRSAVASVWYLSMRPVMRMMSPASAIPTATIAITSRVMVCTALPPGWGRANTRVTSRQIRQVAQRAHLAGLGDGMARAPGSGAAGGVRRARRWGAGVWVWPCLCPSAVLCSRSAQAELRPGLGAVQRGSGKAAARSC